MSTYEMIAKKYIEQGEYRSRIKTIINGYNKGLSIDILAALTDLPEEEVRKIIKENSNNSQCFSMRKNHIIDKKRGLN